MRIESKYDKTATIYRETVTASTPVIKRGYTTHLSDVKCFITAQDSQTRRSKLIDERGTGSFAQYTYMFCNVIDIQEGDKVTVGSNDYRVRGILTFDHGRNPHMEVALSSFDSTYA
jgi:hypothetical protein